MNLPKIDNLRCNRLVSPIGVENTTFSYFLHNVKTQEAYRIIVRIGHNIVYDSNKVMSDNSIAIKCDFELKSRTIYNWSVRVWCENDIVINSAIATFETGILDNNWYGAKWICKSNDFIEKPTTATLPAPVIKRKINISSKIASARLYICGIGYNEVYINGDKLDDGIINPPFTNYNKRILYDTYDVTDKLVMDENVVAVMLGNGCYNISNDTAWNCNYAIWRGHPKMLLNLVLKYENGTEEVIISDSEFKCKNGPIVYNNFRSGEVFDANKIVSLTSDFDGFEDSIVANPPGGIITSMQMPKIKYFEEFPYVSKTKLADGVVYKFPINMAGVAKIVVRGATNGCVTLKYSEKINDKGDIDTSTIDMFLKSCEFQTDKYILNGDGEEKFIARFAYHGFQYVKVMCENAEIIDIKAVRVNTDLDRTSTFNCSNDVINKINDMVINSTLSNYHGIPTDCPQREKNGWTGDVMTAMEQALYNFNIVGSYHKWLRDIVDTQLPSGNISPIAPTPGWGYTMGVGPSWDSIIITLPYQLYKFTGDIAFLEEFYPYMKKYYSYLCQTSNNGLVETGLSDWCAEGNPHAPQCPAGILSTAIFYADSVMLNEISTLLGDNFHCDCDSIKFAYYNKYLQFDGDVVSGIKNDSYATNYAAPIYQGLLNEDNSEIMFNLLLQQLERDEYRMFLGIFGAKFTLNLLERYNKNDVALKIVTNPKYPGWGNLAKVGATSLWEDWGGDNSLNHHMFSDVGRWIMSSIAGIQMGDNGFKKIIIKPSYLVENVKSSVITPYGMVSVEIKGDAVAVVIPSNTTAILYLKNGETRELTQGEYNF